ncbi:MAG: conjugative transposon protein TraN [Ferruginibacter sp.]
MKRSVWLILLSLIFVTSKAQTAISLSTEKTSSLVFPFPIIHVDRGTSAILVQPVKESPSILLVKAGIKDFAETNLSVITSDGSLYDFVLRYDPAPGQLVFYAPSLSSPPVASYANSILDNPKTMRGIKDQKWDMDASIAGIYIKNEVIYYQLVIKNESPLDYDIDLIKFYIRDKKKGKRTAVQENEMKPLYVAGNTSQVKAYNSTSIVFALDKFTIPDAKYLAVELMEKNGGRHLAMRVSNRKILKATSLPDIK